MNLSTGPALKSSTSALFLRTALTELFDLMVFLLLDDGLGDDLDKRELSEMRLPMLTAKDGRSSAKSSLEVSKDGCWGGLSVVSETSRDSET
eukprot:CAMPEP_0115599568 /NCGR_PEP_ID=MMETSP0272-20121206/14454_1 /TAXON_ID=71861 /ORGANISM="Scrippsiella trochoidea, Strain CCMP3099" /LENGTH=91 /DNA_ID=CAMNT_0003035013 /DNA_START=378 /DNA_END=653 /DNA_ORIENTATION=-